MNRSTKAIYYSTIIVRNGGFAKKMPKAGKYDYPYFDVDFAVSKLMEAHENIKSEQTTRTIFAETLGMAEKGGGFAYLIASMEKYSLIETGGGDIKITELGKLAMYGDPAEVEQAKIDAVTGVELFSEIAKNYGKIPQAEQIRAFLRQKANVDIAKAQKIAPKVANIYKKVSKYISLAEKPSDKPPTSEVIGRRERRDMKPDTKTTPLTIQYGNVYIQIPPNDLKAIALAKDALEFMEQRLLKEKGEQKEQKTK